MKPWLVLIVSLPPHPSSLRVRVWRKLRALGAVALKNSVYLLPFTPETYEQFQWLSQEIQKDRGEATLLKVDRIENLKPDEVVRLFQDARDRDYRDLAERYRKLLRNLDRKASRRAAAWRDDEVGRLARDLERIRETDFFDAPGYREVERLKQTIELRRRDPAASAEDRTPTALEGLRGKRWVTRPRPHVDRVASAWLIRRFIDPEAQFLFASPEEFPADAIPFDALGAEFGHQGEDCTFETLLKRSSPGDRRLVPLAEVVHEADLRDQKFHRDEARGIDLAIRGLLAALKDDHEVLAHGMTLFDGLYATIGERS
ncbi:MAG: chromate resistance protein [Candidatus Rokubacteria bacterium]|nr:chromate resistance protein [Candidatus Rokubacteria bacterium]